MTGRRTWVLVLVLLALGGALAVGLTTGDASSNSAPRTAAGTEGPGGASAGDGARAQAGAGDGASAGDGSGAQAGRQAGLRARAALDPCPTGLGLKLNITLPCLGGGAAVTLSAPASGVPTLVNVYGSWCAPCQDEMPVLKAFRDRAGSKVALVGVDTEDPWDQALPFALDFKQHWPAVVDADGVVLRKYGSGPPITLFLDSTGAVVHVQRGAFRSAAQLDALVLKHLGVRL